MIDLSGKTAIITGSGRGIGRATALSLAAMGAEIVVCDIDKKNIELVRSEITDAGGKAIALKCDVTDEKEVGALMSNAISTCNKIDILVNNAGWQYVANIEKSSLDDWEKTMAVNLRGPFLTCRELIPHMKKNGKGVIINVTSRAGRVPKAQAAAYGASKFGLNGFTLCLNLELTNFGIRVLALAPPRTKTPLAEKIMYQFDPNADLSMWPDGFAFGRTIALMASDEAGEIDGQIIETGGLRP